VIPARSADCNLEVSGKRHRPRKDQERSAQEHRSEFKQALHLYGQALSQWSHRYVNKMVVLVNSHADAYRAHLQRIAGTSNDHVDVPRLEQKSERLEIKNLPPQIALEFARRVAKRSELWASNLEAVLPSLVEWTDGNPGAILHMLKMAQFPQYRAGDQIKAHILYVDYRMGRRS
jgi:hypothetical protein